MNDNCRCGYYSKESEGRRICSLCDLGVIACGCVGLPWAREEIQRFQAQGSLVPS